MFWVRKMLSPVGVALILMLLFLPFVGVACGPYEAEISGWDMAVGGQPSVSPPRPADEPSNVPVQPLMIVFVLALFVTAALGAGRRTRFSAALGGLIAAGFAALILVVNQIVVMDDVQHEIAGPGKQGLPMDPSDMVGTRAGFWTTLLAVLALLGFHVTELVLSRRRAPASHWGPYPPGAPWPPQEPPQWSSAPPHPHSPDPR